MNEFITHYFSGVNGGYVFTLVSVIYLAFIAGMRINSLEKEMNLKIKKLEEILKNKEEKS
jgi:hypothetical protein